MGRKGGMPMVELDGMDMRILEILQAEGRIPLTRLSMRLDVPHSTVRDRLRRLEEAGAIDSYTAVINPATVGFPVSAFVMVTLDQRLETASAVAALMSIDEVTETYLLTGDIDVLVRIWARDVEHLRSILYEKFTDVPGLLRTNTVIVLDSRRKPERLPMVALRAKR
jgi:DNA-binding Lrp family transcriptional regulator